MTAAHFSICLPSFPDYTALFLLALLKTTAPLLDLHVNIPSPAPLYYLSLTSNIHHHPSRHPVLAAPQAWSSSAVGVLPRCFSINTFERSSIPSWFPAESSTTNTLFLTSLMPTRVSLTATSLSSLFLPPSQPFAVCTPSILFQPHRALRALQGSSWVL